MNNARDALDEAAVEMGRVTIDVDVVREGAPELAGRSGDHVRVRIGDDGIGMDAATLARIYEPFFTTKAVGKGTGLGLATTYAIVREHGGFVACESLPQQRPGACGSAAYPGAFEEPANRSFPAL